MNSTSRPLKQTEFLSGWKDIANHLGRGVRTAQRYERDLRLPVHRPKGGRRSSVVALRSEIDAWLAASASRDQGLNSGALPLPLYSAFQSFRQGFAEFRQNCRELRALNQEHQASVDALRLTLERYSRTARGSV